jgi:two-component system response regulator FlrC
MCSATILIAESDRWITERFGKLLSAQGHHVHQVSLSPDWVNRLQGRAGDLLIVSDPLQRVSGLDVLASLKRSRLSIPVILIAEKGSVQAAIATVRMGAGDYLLASDADERVLQSILTVLKPACSAPPAQTSPDIVTCAPAMRHLLDLAGRIASSSATVLIQGESGTGKEVIARHIHALSGRPQHAFVALNCAALPETLAESELFGHERGAFTGALQRKTGRFEQAHGGTLLLDEISEMSLPLQAKLLRVLQEKEVDRIGGQKPIPVDVRVIATTNRDLGEMVAQERFRKDLFYRLRIIPLTLPPLRERRQDIPVLVEYFLKKYCPSGNSLPRFSAPALNTMMTWSWPGNIRELENTIERAVLIAGDAVIGPEYLLLDEPVPGKVSAAGACLVGLTVKELEERLIVQTLREVNQNRTHAAEMLGISIRTLRNKLREYRQEGENVADYADGS